MGVLDGIKILELARVPPAELPGMLLADMGAEVLKIDAPIPVSNIDEQAERRSTHSFVNRNKQSMTLNLKSSTGQAIFHTLAKDADIVIEGFRPGVMDRLGAGYARLREFNSRLIYCSLSGFGQTGPYRNAPAHDLNYLALAGVLNLIGDSDRKHPVIPLNLIADYGGASLHAALGVMFALYARERTQLGQYVDIAYLDSTISLLAATPSMRSFFAEGTRPRRGVGIFSGTYPYYAIYETRDGKLITIGCLEPHSWEKFCKAINRMDLIEFGHQAEHFDRAADERENRTREAIQGIIRGRDRDEWYEYLVKEDVCVGKVYDVEEVTLDPQVIHRNMIVDVEHPTYGHVREFGIAIKLSETPGTIRTAAPLRGQHTESILKHLGFAPEDIVSLRISKVIE